MSSEIIKHTAQQDCERVSSQSFNTLLADVQIGYSNCATDSVAQLGKAKTQPAVAQLPEYNFTLPIIHLSWISKL